jgi:hypothetical protein
MALLRVIASAFRLAGLLTAGLIAFSAAAQTPPANLLNANYDAAVPTVQSVIGHASGAEITSPDETLAWFRALARAAPDRVVVTPYAKSWEGRELIIAVISAPQNIARLDAIKSNMAKLASGTLSPAERDRLVADTPAIVWLGYGVHGDEISSTDAAIALSYHLVAAHNESDVAKVLANTVVVIDPMQNPDGRNRFVNSFEAARGLRPSGDRNAAEHDQPWPGGRYNHYLFDMNRDWFAMTQPETQGRMREMLTWRPTVVVDAHEQGGDASYFFPPVAQPVNPNVTKGELDLQTLIGRNNAKAFDARGFDYFNRDTYDLFYPGFGDSWPSLNGAIAFTYEQAGASGLIFNQSSGAQMTYRDGVLHHLVATLTTAETVADNKTRFLSSYAAYRAQAIADGRAAKDRFFVVDLARHRWQAENLARRLAQQDIAVTRADPGARLCGRAYPSGALVIDGAQPSHALLETLLSPDTPLDEKFMALQEKRRAAGLPHQLYDVTAWSLPLMDGLSLASCASAAPGKPIAASDPIPAPAITGDATFGYVVPWTDAGQAKLVFAALHAGFAGRSVDRPFTANGRTYGRGAVIFAASHNPATMASALPKLAQSIGAELVPMASSWVEDGPNYGSADAHDLRRPRIAMAWDNGVDPTGAGAARFVIEQKFGVPVTPIRTGSMAGADLSNYRVLILPEGYGYGEALGEGGRQAISKFVEDGGVLVGMGTAMRWLGNPNTGLSSLRRERAFADPKLSVDGKADGQGKPATVPGTRLNSQAELEAVQKNQNAAPDVLPGALVWAEADNNNWLSSGYDRTAVLASGSDIYAPLNAGDGETALRFASADRLLASGYIWKENRLQLALKPYATVESKGKGLIVGFTQNPVSRAYLNGLDLLVANAVLLGPAHTN